MHDTIRALLTQSGRLTTEASTLPVDADLYTAGLTSHGSVTLMLAIEEAFDVEFPDRMLTREVFSSIGAIAAAVAELQAVAAA
ncbi:MAG: acyl carrier protein [Solirubrobacterales bacterium]|jgi:acyl carrier protein|nr:acyl carrier protein [Solirubrobacterales bacterium]